MCICITVVISWLHTGLVMIRGYFKNRLMLVLLTQFIIFHDDGFDCQHVHGINFYFGRRAVTWAVDEVQGESNIVHGSV